MLTFAMGMNYQKNISGYNPINVPVPGNGVASTLDAKICPDGSSVGRVAPDCEFAACPPVRCTTDENPCNPQSCSYDSSVCRGTAGESFSGVIQDITYGCHVDSICSVILDNGFEVIVMKGDGPVQEDKGHVTGIDLNEQKKADYIGMEVNGYAGRLIDNTYTIYGNSGYYLGIASPD